MTKEAYRSLYLIYTFFQLLLITHNSLYDNCDSLVVWLWQLSGVEIYIKSGRIIIFPSHHRHAILATGLTLVLSFLAVIIIAHSFPQAVGDCNQWMYNGQFIVQIVLLLVAVICVPIILIPKPYLMRSQHRARVAARQVAMANTPVRHLVSLYS